MKHTKYILALVMVMPTLTFGAAKPQPTCADIFVETEKAGAAITKSQIDTFLGSLKCEYFKGAEGGEFGNELLFSILLTQPSELIASFDRQDKSIQERILHELTQPINDGIDLPAIYRRVSGASGDEAAKERILAALRVGAGGAIK